MIMTTSQPIRRYGPIWLATALTFLSDEVAKTLARALLPLCHASEGTCHQVGPTSWLGFVRMENGGSPLGFAQGLWVWIALALAGALLVPVYARARGGDPALWLAAGLQLGGALGNLTDRIAYGGATDFLLVGGVVLNLADLALLAGALIGTWALACPRQGRPLATGRR